MGKGEFSVRPMKNAGRGVWTISLPGGELGREDIEYYVQAITDDGHKVVWPATAPGVSHVVTWIESEI